jgi:hypothetical protein
LNDDFIALHSMKNSLNPFIILIRQGIIRNIADLKHHFHQSAIQTHPDTSGARDSERFKTIRSQYEEAFIFLENQKSAEIPDYRNLFYQEWRIYEILNSDISKNKPGIHTLLKISEENLLKYFKMWMPDQQTLIQSAIIEINTIRSQGKIKTLKELRHPSFETVLKPFIHSLLHYQKQGTKFHRQQIVRMASAILLQLSEKNLWSLHQLFLLLMNDLEITVD